MGYFISFIYRIGQSKQTYYGKYICDHIYTNHPGLDAMIRPLVKEALNAYRVERNRPEIQGHIWVGIMGVTAETGVSMYTTTKERKVFDFYCLCNGAADYYESYVNGRLAFCHNGQEQVYVQNGKAYVQNKS